VEGRKGRAGGRRGDYVFIDVGGIDIISHCKAWEKHEMLGLGIL
jgi:hypothetical protein